MQVLDIPLHQMSVTGLIISLGLLIDNAIVVVEDYKLRRSRGAQIDEAISRAIKHLLVPLGRIHRHHRFCFYAHSTGAGRRGRFYRHAGGYRSAIDYQFIYFGNDHCARNSRLLRKSLAGKGRQPLVADRFFEPRLDEKVPRGIGPQYSSAQSSASLLPALCRSLAFPSRTR